MDHKEPREGKVLAVEDDPRIQRLIASVLRAEGYNVVTASDGAEGLRRAEDSVPTIILLDLMMPGVDGWEFLRRLRGRGDDTPVVLISAIRDLAREARSLGADYLEKPFGVGQLLDKVGAVTSTSGLRFRTA